MDIPHRWCSPATTVAVTHLPSPSASAPPFRFTGVVVPSWYPAAAAAPAQSLRNHHGQELHRRWVAHIRCALRLVVRLTAQSLKNHHRQELHRRWVAHIRCALSVVETIHRFCVQIPGVIHQCTLLQLHAMIRFN